MVLIACDTGDLQAAAGYLPAVRPEDVLIGLNRGAPNLLAAAAVLAVTVEAWRAAASLLGAAALVFHDMPYPPPEGITFERAAKTARQHLGEDAWVDAWHAGRHAAHIAITTEMDRVLAHASGTSGPSPSGSVLTPREHEVLRLLIEGHSNREIAEALFISYRTADTHVSNILGKFGVTTRAAAVTYAFQHDLA